MSAVRDIGLNENDDLDFQNGDFTVIKSDYQHAEDILMSHLGHFKNLPTIGVNLPSETLSTSNNQRLRRLIKLHFTSDRYQVGEVVIKQDLNTKIVERIDLKRLNEPED